MRVSVILSMLVAGHFALAACGPSRYVEYDDDERYAKDDRYYEKEQARRAKPRKVARAKPQQEQPSRAAVAESTPEPIRKSAQSEPPSATRREPQSETKVAEKPRPAAEDKSAAESKPAQDSKAAAAEQKANSEAATDEAAKVEAKKQIEDGYRLLRAGFVKKARERFERAMKSNAAEASLGQGRSMDPSYLKTVAFPDVVPNAEEARRVYRRAVMLGSQEAKSDLERLEKAIAAAQPTTLSPATPAQAAPNSESKSDSKSE